MRCYRRLLNIPYKAHVTNDEVRRKIQSVIGEYNELLDPGQETETKMVWPCIKGSGLAKTILRGTVKGKRRRGRQKRR